MRSFLLRGRVWSWWSRPERSFQETRNLPADSTNTREIKWSSALILSVHRVESNPESLRRWAHQRRPRSADAFSARSWRYALEHFKRRHAILSPLSRPARSLVWNNPPPGWFFMSATCPSHSSSCPIWRLSLEGLREAWYYICWAAKRKHNCTIDVKAGGITVQFIMCIVETDFILVTMFGITSINTVCSPTWSYISVVVGAW